jgi:hypothetical protein
MACLWKDELPETVRAIGKTTCDRSFTIQIGQLKGVMIADEIGMPLHDRSTLGDVLNPEEQALLEAWYAQKDTAEAAMLERQVTMLPSLQMLQVQLEAALTQLSSSIAQLQQIGAENEQLRLEIAGLKRQLTLPRSA